MPDLTFQVVAVEPASRGLSPLLRFSLRIANAAEKERIQGLMLHAQIQLRPAERLYSANEKENLTELFGSPDRWGQTLRNRLWDHVDTNVPPFDGETLVSISVPCTYDLNVAATKYFHALEDGDVAVSFLFSGTVFFTDADGRLQMQGLNAAKACPFTFPIRVWREMIEAHFPNTDWLYSLERLPVTEDEEAEVGV